MNKFISMAFHTFSTDVIQTVIEANSTVYAVPLFVVFVPGMFNLVKQYVSLNIVEWRNRKWAIGIL